MSKKDELIKLYKESFDDSPEYINNFFKQYYSKRNTRCIVDNGDLVSALYLVIKRLVFSEKILRTFFLVGVATKEKYRKKGYLKKLIRLTLDDLALMNTPFVMLYPNKREVYEKLGFVTVSQVGKYFAKYDGIDAKNRIATEEDVFEIFNKTNQKAQIYQYRNEKDIRKIMARWAVENIVPRIFERDGKVCYVAYSDKEIEEAIGDLSVLNGVKEFDGIEFIDYFGDSEPYVMARVVSPICLLRNLNYKKVTANFSVKIVDDLYPEKESFFNIDLLNGSPQVEYSKKYEFILDCKDLTKIAFGMDVANCPLNEYVEKERVVFVDKY